MKHTTLIYFLFVLSMGSLLSGCDESPYRIEMLSYDSQTDSMVYKVNTVQTLSDLGKLEGRATRLRGGLSIILDYSASSPMIRWKNVGATVAFSAIEIDNIYYPSDFKSLAMVSIYYNIEQAMLFFESIGMESGLLGRLDTYYWAEVVEKYDAWGEDDPPLVDNAFYLPITETDRGFYILPFGSLTTGVPVSMNPGVIAHEYSHAVFQQLVYDRIPMDMSGNLMIELTGYNFLYGVNEGIADIFAVAMTGDPDFIRPSMNLVDVVRDASEIIIYENSFDAYVEDAEEQIDNPYEIGAFVSATVYEIARRIQGLPPNGDEIPAPTFRHLTAKATYDAISDLGIAGVEYFEPADFFSSFIQSLAVPNGQIACDVLMERFQLHYSEVEGCQ